MADTPENDQPNGNPQPVDVTERFKKALAKRQAEKAAPEGQDPIQTDEGPILEQQSHDADVIEAPKDSVSPSPYSKEEDTIEPTAHNVREDETQSDVNADQGQPGEYDGIEDSSLSEETTQDPIHNPADDPEHTEAGEADSIGTDVSVVEDSETGIAQSKEKGPSPFGTHKVNEATLYLREAQHDLKKTAQQIEMGEFNEAGAGDAGRIYRSCLETPASGMGPVWSEIIALCAGLWEEGYEVAAVNLIEKSYQSFEIPDAWRTQVEGAMEAANDFKTARDAEFAFEQGDDTTALTLAKTIKDDDGEIFQQQLNSRIKKRKRSRKIAVGVAGVAIVGLLTISGIGIMTAERLYRAAPAPSFEGIGGALESLSRDLRNQRDQRDQQVQVEPVETPVEPNTQVPVIEDTTPVTDTIDTPNDTPSSALEQIFDQPDQGPEPVVAPESTQNPVVTPSQETQGSVLPEMPSGNTTGEASEFRPLQPQTQGQEQQPQTTPEAVTPQTTQPQPEVTQTPQEEPEVASVEQQIQDCILGYAVVAQAEQMLANGVFDAQTLPNVQARLTSFSSVLAEGCQRLNISPITIAGGIANLDQNRVREITNNLLTR